MNKVRFPCIFHGRQAQGILRLEEDHTFACTFLLDEGKVAWPFRGTWALEPDSMIRLTTPHGYAWVLLQVDWKSNSLLGVAQGGGFADFNIRGVHSTRLQNAEAIR